MRRRTVGLVVLGGASVLALAVIVTTLRRRLREDEELAAALDELAALEDAGAGEVPDEQGGLLRGRLFDPGDLDGIL